MSPRSGRTVSALPPQGRSAASRPSATRPSTARPAASVAGSVFRPGRPRRRLRAVFVVIAVAFLAILGRVAVLQLFEADAYASYGARQRLRSTILPAARGTIFDRNGAELAISGPRSTIWADPRLVTDPAGTAAQLAPLLGLDAPGQAALQERLAKPAEFAYVARQVDDALGQQVMDLGLPGLSTYDEPRRFYPNGRLAAGVLGLTDPDGAGIAGLEKRYDDVLGGRPGELLRERGRDGNTIPSGRHELVPATPGDDLVLTVDRALQYQVERLLERQVTATQSRGGMVVVMDTHTGELLAMANVRLDPDTGEPVSTSANLSVVDTYEPGSVAKIVTAAAALEDAVATPSSVYTVPYQKRFYDHVFVDAVSHGTVNWTLADIIRNSSNIGTMMVSEQVGQERMEHFLRAFGFGERTTLDFPGEADGLLKPASKWQGTENVTVAYGQGIGVTALQLAAAMNTIANRGTYVGPNLVKATIGHDGAQHPVPPPLSRQVLRPEVAEQMNLILRDAICRGTGKRAQIDGYTVAGKTGTAYKARDAGGYADASGTKEYYASFAGFLPAEDPRLTILVSIDEPPASGDHYGGLVAAPLFVDVAKAAVSRLQIPPLTTGTACPGGG